MKFTGISDKGMQRIAQGVSPFSEMEAYAEKVLDAVYAVMEDCPSNVDPKMVLNRVRDSLSVHSSEGYGV